MNRQDIIEALVAERYGDPVRSVSGADGPTAQRLRDQAVDEASPVDNAVDVDTQSQAVTAEESTYQQVNDSAGSSQEVEVDPMEGSYLAPCSRSDGCRVASITFACTSRSHNGRAGQLGDPTVMTADCGWTTRIPQGAERHLTDALQRWQRHECRKRAAS